MQNKLLEVIRKHLPSEVGETLRGELLALATLREDKEVLITKLDVQQRKYNDILAKHNDVQAENSELRARAKSVDERLKAIRDREDQAIQNECKYKIKAADKHISVVEGLVCKVFGNPRLVHTRNRNGYGKDGSFSDETVVKTLEEEQ